MSDRHLLVVVVFAVLCATFLALFGACHYMLKYGQLMPGKMDEQLKNARLGNAALAAFFGLATTYAIFWK